jgi:glyoxylate carboligase
MSNYNAAVSQMQLNPQEQALYQMHLSNLYGTGGVNNADGSRSSLYQTTFEIEGKNYVIPTVWGGKILPPDQALQMAKQYGLDKFPSYGSDEEAEARYQQMHGYMEKDTAAYLQGRK